MKMMPLPTLSTCNLLTKNKEHTNLVVHCLDDLLATDIYIPKKPHRHTFYQVLFIKEGNGVHKIDFHDYPISGNTLYFLSPGQAHNLELSQESIGILINFGESLFHTFLANTGTIDEFPFFAQSGKHSYYQLMEKDRIIFDVLERIRENRSNAKLVRLYLLELFYLVNDNIKEWEKKEEYSSAHHLMQKFEKLIEQNYDLEHYPKFYAGELAVTPNYLNAICQKLRSKTAGALIRERIILEIKRLLINSQLSVAEIAYLLGFDDNSYFTKFFKQYEGVTPSDFRKKL